FGNGPVTAAATNSLFVAKYSSAGTWMWFNQVGNAFANAVAVDGSGNVLVTGYYSGTVNFGGASLSSINGGTDVFVAKYSSSGGYVWAKSYGGSSIDMPKAIAVDGSGNAVVIG